MQYVIWEHGLSPLQMVGSLSFLSLYFTLTLSLSLSPPTPALTCTRTSTNTVLAQGRLWNDACGLQLNLLTFKKEHSQPAFLHHHHLT